MRLKELRHKNKVTQIELARLMNVTSQTVLNWENGLHDPSISQLKFLADYFHVSIDYLVERESPYTIINDACEEIEKMQNIDFIKFICTNLKEMVENEEKSKKK
jgi:transcriptional regulator with XRE-family HTH domain